MTSHQPSVDLTETATLVERLARIDRGDATDESAMRDLLDIVHGAQARINPHIRTTSLRPREEPQVLPPAFVSVMSMLYDLIDRALWVHNACVCNKYGVRNHRLAFEPAPVVFAPS